MGKKINLSVIILSGDETPQELAECKKHLGFADEIVIVDVNKIKGSFSQWRNEGLKISKGDWVFYVDTDEEVTPALRQEIAKLLDGSMAHYNAYAVPRKNIIFGKEFKHSGQYPDYQKRLFKKQALTKWMGDLHEEPVFEGNLGHLENPIIHHKNISISQMLDKTNKWSEIEAHLLFDSGHPRMNIFRFASAAFREFWLRFVKQQAFLDGDRGIIYGIYQIYSKLITYSKLWEKQQSTIRT
jgi:glycosyltransferase involved in cell wall biosynthesis